MCSRNLAFLSRAGRSSAIGARGTTDLGREFYPRLDPPSSAVVVIVDDDTHGDNRGAVATVANTNSNA